jgi:hypothetical protein
MLVVRSSIIDMQAATIGTTSFSSLSTTYVQLLDACVAVVAMLSADSMVSTN